MEDRKIQNFNEHQENLNTSDANKPLFKYIEVIGYDEENVVKRLDVSNKTDRSIDKIESGMNINLNHDQFYTVIRSSEVELEKI
jgi:hypothetical protein